MADAGLTAAYVLALLASGVGALGVAAWVFVRSDVPERRLFVGLLVVDTLWVTSAAVGLLVLDPTVTWVLLHVKAALAVTVAALWYVFASVYTGRTLWRWQSVVVLAPLAFAVAAVATNPLHHAHWASLTYRSEPLSFVETTPTLLVPAVNLWVFLTIGIGLYYVAELFMKSRHRTRLSLFVLAVGNVTAALPNVASNLGYVPVPAYDHTVFGVVAFAVASGYAIFGLGLFDVRPVARDTLFEQVDDALFVLDEEGRLIDYNAASETLSVELAEGDPIGRPLATVCPAVGTDLTMPAAGERASDLLTVEERGGTVHYDSTVTAVTEHGDVVGYSVVLREVTTDVQYRRELERRNEQLDQFASAVAHDLRNPLQVAFGQAKLLESAVPSAVENDDTTASVDRLTESLDRMDDIIADLRDLAEKGQSVETATPVDIESVAEEAWERAGTETGTLEVAASAMVVADRSRLLSVFENLFRNAVDHGATDTPEASGEADDGESTVTCRVALTDDGFYVADDGPGIPEADREDVFEYGYTTESDGSGLGLAIVETMVAAHGWDIEVTDSEAGGAKFVVSGATTRRSPPQQ